MKNYVIKIIVFCILSHFDSVGKDILFGSCVKWNSIHAESDYREQIVKNFNVIVPEYEIKQYFIHPAPDKTNYSHADSLVSFARRNQMLFRGHALLMVGKNPSPKWFYQKEWDKKEFEFNLKSNIQSVASRYRGKIFAWDVVNEAFDRDGNVRSNVFTKKIGVDYIQKAFLWAHESDPHAKLFYADYGFYGINSKSDAIYSMVKDFKSKNIPINGVGFHLHLYIDGPMENIPDFSDMADNIKRFEELGMEIQFTEIDVSIHKPVTREKLMKQGHIYAELFRLFVAHKNCTAFIMWGFTDKYTWILKHTEGQYCTPCILDSLYRPKPAYDSLRAVIKQYGNIRCLINEQ